MDQNTVKLLMQIIQLAIQLTPVVTAEVQRIQAQGGKSASEIFSEAGLAITDNEQEALAQLAELMKQN